MSAPQLAPGTVVAQKYQLGACLGYAGSSATYQAAAGDGREVVLKLFDAAIRQRTDIMAALEQTYAATNALPQDVAVPLLDAGYDAATGAPFSVSERIPFPSLSQLVAQQPLTPEETANVLAMMAHVLDKAHARQLFHHALKPGNVFVGFAQGAGIRVTDFGAGLSRSAVPTQEGYALAAPWLAPEQVQGSAPPGAPADVFSAALVAFFALTGRSYWRSCQAPLDLAGWQRELTSPRTPPSARALQLGVTLNSAFDGVLGCALSADPGQRYRSVGELAHALEELAGQKAPPSQATMALAYPQGSLPALGSVVVGGGGGGGGGYPPPPAPPPGVPQGGPRMPSSPALMTQQVPGGYGPAPGPMSMPTTPGLGGPGAGYPPAGMPPQQQQAQPPVNAGYNSTQPSSDLGETAAGRPVDPAVFQRRASPNRLVPILVGLVALLLLVSAAAAFVLLGKKPDAHPTTAASAADSAAAGAAPADSAAPSATASASAAPTDSAAASAAPADSASAAPADSASAAPSADADAGPPQVEVALTCDPDCDEVKIDDNVVDITKPLTLPPGKHVVRASKAGYQNEKVTLEVKGGEKLEKTIKLKEKVAVPTGPAVPPPSKPCGKFLKRCK